VPSGHRRDDQHPTSRPLDHAGIVANAGQSWSDRASRSDNDLTPELSGIFSYSNPEKTFGVSLSASQQKRRAAGAGHGELLERAALDGVDAGQPDRGERPGRRPALCAAQRPALRVLRIRARTRQWPGSAAVRNRRTA
jgi:hypothetical protein